MSVPMTRGELYLKGSAVVVGLAMMSLSAGWAAEGDDNRYPSKTTAVVLVDPLNDFISDGGKLWGRIKPVASEVNLVPNLVKLTDGARKKGVRVVYAPHHRWRPGPKRGQSHRLR